MNIMALCTWCPDDPTNGVAIRTWGLCGQGHVPCHFLEHRAHREAGAVDTPPLPWVNITKCTFREMLALARKHQSEGGIVFVHGLPLATRMAREGAIPDVIDIVDSYSLYFKRRFHFLSLRSPLRKFNALLQSARHRCLEYLASRRSWTIVAASDEDAARFSGGKARAIGLPNGTSWADLPPLYQHRDRATRIGFHGTMTWDPNVSAAEFIAHMVMPMVLRRTPDASIRIFGGPLVPRIEALRGLPGIEIMGPVSDIRSCLAEIDVYLMPMLQGSGVKNKLMEAMAAGLPVVTNPLGVEAFAQSIGSAALIGTSPSELAAHVSKLFEDGEARKRLSAESRAFAVRQFSPRRLEARLVDILTEA